MGSFSVALRRCLNNVLLSKYAQETALVVLYMHDAVSRIIWVYAGRSIIGVWQKKTPPGAAGQLRIPIAATSAGGFYLLSGCDTTKYASIGFYARGSEIHTPLYRSHLSYIPEAKSKIISGEVTINLLRLL